MLKSYSLHGAKKVKRLQKDGKEILQGNTAWGFAKACEH